MNEMRTKEALYDAILEMIDVDKITDEKIKDAAKIYVLLHEATITEAIHEKIENVLEEAFEDILDEVIESLIYEI